MELKKTTGANIQNKKSLFLEIGLCMSLIIVLVAFNWTTKEKAASLLIVEHQGIVEEPELVPITQPDTPPPPEIPAAPQIPDMIDIVENDVLISSNFDFSESEKNDPIRDLIYIPSVIKDSKDVDEIIPFAIVEEKPKFQGKDASEFVKWIYANLTNNYPQAALENNIQGVVRVSFTVNIDGTLSDIKSLRKTDPILENCVIELIRKSPEWTPGRQQNKPVKVTYQAPVTFRLQ